MHYISTWLNRDLLQDRIGKTPDKQLDAWFRKHLGQCGEMIFVGFCFFKDRIAQIEPVTIENGNHCFLVLGRDPTTSLENPSEWNTEAVICDPWTGSCFPASLHEQHLLASTDINHTEDFYTLVEPWRNATRRLIPCKLSEPSIAAIEEVRTKYLTSPDARPFFLFPDPKEDNDENQIRINNPYAPPATPKQPSMTQIQTKPSPTRYYNAIPRNHILQRVLTLFERLRQMILFIFAWSRSLFYTFALNRPR